jgi:hypothetical protein
LDHELNAIMMLAPVNPHGKRLRKRYGKVRNRADRAIWNGAAGHEESRGWS